MKTGIVCEGGGMRGVYTSGVLQAFMDNNFLADELVGVSAGASNGISYVSAQRERGLRTNIDYVGDKRYLSLRNYLKTGSLFGMDFIFEEIPDSLDPFDYEAFHASPCDYFAGATDVTTGKAVFFGKQDIVPGLAVMKASCSIPFLAPIVEYNGGKYLDGGVAAPIPVEKAIADGCERLIIILTRGRGYKKKPQKLKTMTRLYYREYPAMAKALAMRHLIYNHTLEQISRLEKEGRAIVIAPSEPLTVDRFGQDKEKLLQAYNLGYKNGVSALSKLL